MIEAISNELPISLIKEHHLSGYLFKRTADSKYSSDWKSQYFCNSIIKNELEDLGYIFKQKNVAVCLLKGFALLGDVYPDWGSRFASDVDILVENDKLEKTKLVLEFCGYQELKTKKWRGDDFKSLFVKTVKNIEVTIEIHTRLFWHTDIDLKDNFKINTTISGYHCLTPELQLIHLCGHLGFQHTFLKLFWLVDINEYLKKYRHQIDWPKLWNLSLKYKLFKSVYLPIYLCHRMRILNLRLELNKAPRKFYLSMTLLAFLLDANFLLRPKEKYWKYFLIKNLVKDSWLDNLSYNRAWLIHKTMS